MEAILIFTSIAAFGSVAACCLLRQREMLIFQCVNDFANKFSAPCDKDAVKIKEEACIICFEPLSAQTCIQCNTCKHITHAVCLHDHLIYSTRCGRLGKCVMGCE